MEGTNDGEVSIPPWLNAELLTEILSEETNSNISVTNVDVKTAVPKGDNYLSTLYRITVECNESKDGNEVNTYFLVLKTLPSGDFIQKLLSDMEGFEKELRMYQITLPAMYRAMKDVNNGKLRPLSARYLPTRRKNIIVLEDLQHLGYKMANRQAGLDLEHCKMAVRSLARFHALSVALHKTDPSSMDMYSEGMYKNTKERRENLKLHFEFSLNTIASMTEKWPGYEKYSNKIRALIPTSTDQIIKSVEPKKDSLNVLNHGDYWVNNIMFHYCPKTGKVDDAILIDFQIARFASPALDLQYFLCTSTNDDMRFRQTDLLLSEYHTELSDTLKSLELDPDQFTLQQLKEEFEEKEMFGLITVCTMLCAMLASSSETPDLSELRDDFKEDDYDANPLRKALEGNRYRQVLQTFLHYYESKGIL
jgi:thiamine kinase-like enzyme